MRAVPSTNSPIRLCNSSRTCGVKLRAVPRKSACCGMTLSVAGLEGADGDDCGFQGVDIARDDGLQLVDYLRADQNSVDGKMWPRRVSALAVNLDLQVVGSSHDGTR